MGKLFLGFLAMLGIGSASRDEPDMSTKPDADPTPTPVPPDSEPTEPMEADWLAELNAQLQAAGVTNFTAEEFTLLPKAKPKARHDMPPRELWPNLIAVAKLAQEVRDLYGEPIWISSAWRPKWYNDAVGGAAKSQHIHAAAVDLNVLPSRRNPTRTRKLEHATAKVWKTNNTARGFGVYKAARTHIDVGGGRRTWGDAQRVLGEMGDA